MIAALLKYYLLRITKANSKIAKIANKSDKLFIFKICTDGFHISSVS